MNITSKTERINAINAAYEKVIADVNERRNYRWNNYYNCVDDYSVCGPCEHADSAEENAARMKRDYLLEEVENGFHIEKGVRYSLLNKNDEEVASGAINGKFGTCFYDSVNNCWVGLPRKITTLTKKGYKLAKITNIYNCKLNTVNIHCHAINKEMVLADVKVEVLNEIPDYINTDTNFSDWNYNTNFKVA